MEHEKVADHYNARPKETREGRNRSVIFHMRQFNNWLKYVLIDLHTKPGCSVLDLCCGKGGDLHKWLMVGCTQYVGCDIADRSVTTAMERFNEMLGKGPTTFRPKLFVGDMFNVRLSKFCDQNTSFDVVSCQFSMHLSLIHI